MDSVVSFWARSLSARVPTEQPDRFRFNADAAEPAEPIDRIELAEYRIAPAEKAGRCSGAACDPGRQPRPVPAAPIPTWSGFQKTVVQLALTMR